MERHRRERAEIDRRPVDLDPRAILGAQHALAAQPYRLADAARCGNARQKLGRAEVERGVQDALSVPVRRLDLEHQVDRFGQAVI